MTKIVKYIIRLTEDTQLRHLHTHWKNEVVSFCIQLEVYQRGKWQPIIRYDTSHGFAHKDTLHPNGRKDKIPLSGYSLKEALNFSDKDLKNNWKFYRERFLKEAKNE